MHVFSNVCRHDPTLVFAFEGIEYSGASASGVETFKGDFVINFTRNRNVPINTEDKFAQLKKYFNISFEELQVPWPDYGIPKVKMGFWKVLHEFIKKRKWEQICFHCEGGHGRTGTALSAMLIANAGYTPAEAVEWVREVYCEDAVESQSQCTYLGLVDKHYNHREQTPDTKATIYGKGVIKRSDIQGGWSGSFEYGLMREDDEDDKSEKEDKKKESEFKYPLIDDEEDK